jgi:hypothetical protein
MPKKLILDKLFDVGVTYRCEEDKYYVIRKVGTNSTSKATLYIDGHPVLDIIDKIAPNAQTSGNRNQLLDLGELYLVVPRNKTLNFTGSTGSTMRLVGELYILGAGESESPEHLSRFKAQSTNYFTYLSASVSKSAGTVISAGAEETVLDWTAPVDETWTFDNLYMAEGMSDTTNVPQMYSRIYIEESPLDLLQTAMGKKGISGLSAPYPPRDAVNAVPFSLKDMPLEILPGKSLRITYVNTGSDYTVPTGTTFSFNVVLVGKRKIL